MKIRASLVPQAFAVTAILGSLSILFTPGSASALGGPHSKVCSSIFVNEGLAVRPADLNAQLKSRYASPNIRAYAELLELKKIWKNADDPVNKNLLKAMNDLLLDEEMSVFHELLKTAMKSARQKLVANLAIDESASNEQVRAALVEAVRLQSVNMMKPATAEKRAKLLLKPKIDKATLMMALGRLTEAETRTELVGKGELTRVAKDSLMGRYIQEAADLGVDVQPFAGALPLGPNKSGLGRARLFVPVDAKTTRIIERLVGQNPHFLIHNHDPGQGTLEMYHFGHSGSPYHQARGKRKLGSGAGQSVVVGKLAPLMVLSTTEGSRVENYFELGAKQQSFAKYPSGLKNAEGSAEVDYCRTGGYASCTHWVGEMPLGDQMVSQLKFPKNNNDDPYGRDPGDALAKANEKVRTGPVGYYTHFRSRGDFVELDEKQRTHRLVRMVYKQGRANAQLWEVAGGLEAELGAGEFANPGWVLHSLAAASNPERVPVVLVYVRDASVRLTQAELERLAAEEVSPR